MTRKNVQILSKQGVESALKDELINYFLIKKLRRGFLARTF
jgi:hypothetical protein